MTLEEFEHLHHRINNPDIENKGLEYTLKDLNRTSRVLLSTEDSLDLPATSWWSDYSPLSLDLMRHFAGVSRRNKIIEFAHPSATQIREQILNFFNYSQAIKQYIEDNANQHNFTNAAESEIRDRLILSGYICQLESKTSKTIEFRRMHDGSVNVYESFNISGPILNTITDEELQGRNGNIIARVRLKTNISEQDGVITHEVLDLKFNIVCAKQCKKLLESEQLSVLSKYVSEKQKHLITELSREDIDSWTEVSREQNDNSEEVVTEVIEHKGGLPMTNLYLRAIKCSSKEEGDLSAVDHPITIKLGRTLDI